MNKNAHFQDPVVTTISSYEAKAAEYVHNTDRLEYFPSLPKMLDTFMSLLPGRTVLDVGFGSGRDTIYLTQNGLCVTAIELTQSFLDRSNGTTTAQLCKMDMRNLAFKDSTFDGIWCCATFLHLPRPQARPTLREFKRVLHPNGIMYLDLKEGEGEEWVTSEQTNVTGVSRFYTYYRLEEIVRLLQEIDLEIILAQVQPQSVSKDKIALTRSRWLNLVSRRIT